MAGLANVTAKRPPVWEDFLGCLETGDTDTALAMCQRGVEADSAPGRWLLGRGWVLVGQGRLPEALAAVAEATSAGADELLAARTLAVIHLRLGNPEEALAAAEIAFRLDNDEASHRLLIAARAAAQPPDGARAGRTAAASQPTARTTAPVIPVQPLWAGHTRELPRRPLTRGDKVAIDAQLEALFGESLFGRWHARVAAAAVPGWTRTMRPAIGWPRVLLLGVLIAATIGGAGIVFHALGLRRARVGVQALDRLDQTLHAGAFEQLDVFLSENASVLAAASEADSSAALRLARAHAAVYRFHDARADRPELARAALRLAKPEEREETIIVRALLASTAERIAMLPALAAAAARPSEDGLASYLLATVLLRIDDVEAAEVAVDRALTQAPANMVFLDLAALVAARRGQLPQAGARIAEMRDINPNSAWTELAGQRLAVLSGAEAHLPTSTPPAAVLPPGPVAQTEAAWLVAVEAWRRGDEDAARQQINAVRRFVGTQPALLLDLAESLLVAGAPQLALSLTEEAAWPAEALAARAAALRAAMASRPGDDVRRALVDLWRAGWRDPTTNLLLATTLVEGVEPNLQPAAVLTETLETWPNCHEAAVLLAEIFCSTDQTERAAAQVKPRLSAIKTGAPHLMARSLMVLARAGLGRNDLEDASRWARRAVAAAPRDEAARSLLEEIKRSISAEGAARGRSKRRGKRR